jgi:hypothetical protein
MKRIIRFFNTLSENQLIALVTAASIPLTLWVIYLQHGWITDDSVLYFEVARLFSAGEWAKGYSLYGWPLYPALIAFVHKLSGLDIQHAAQLLNVVFFAITTYSFTTLIRLAGGNRTVISCGALLLFGSPYIVGDILPTFLRDQGFWAAMLTSLVFFIRFYRDGKISDAIYWQLCAILAVLFRIEGITFLVALPLVVLSEPSFTRRQKSIKLLQAWLLSILLGCVVVLVTAFTTYLSLHDLGRLGNLLEISGNLYGQITDGLILKADVMGKQVLGRFLDEYALAGLIATLVFILLMKFINSIGIWATITLALTYKPAFKSMLNDAMRILLWLAALAVLNASIILVHTFILSTRYVVILGFVLLIFTSFGLGQLLSSLQKGVTETALKKSLAGFLLAIFVLHFIINLLPKRDGYNFEQEAVEWIKAHAQPGDKIFYSSPRERFYAGEPFTKRNYELWSYTLQAISEGAIHDYDFLLVNVEDDLESRTRFLIENLPHHQISQEFFSDRNRKKVVIFVKNN